MQLLPRTPHPLTSGTQQARTMRVTEGVCHPARPAQTRSAAAVKAVRWTRTTMRARFATDVRRVAAAAVSALTLAGCGARSPLGAAEDSGVRGGGGKDASEAPSGCVVTPPASEGPVPVCVYLVRPGLSCQQVVEGEPGSCPMVATATFGPSNLLGCCVGPDGESAHCYYSIATAEFA